MRLRCQDRYDLHFSPDTHILRTIKSSMKWVGVGACGTYGGEEVVGAETRRKKEHFET